MVALAGTFVRIAVRMAQITRYWQGNGAENCDYWHGPTNEGINSFPCGAGNTTTIGKQPDRAGICKAVRTPGGGRNFAELKAKKAALRLPLLAIPFATIRWSLYKIATKIPDSSIRYRCVKHIVTTVTISIVAKSAIGVSRL